MKAPTEKELNELWESIGQMDINPGALAAQEHLAAGHPVYGHEDGLAPDELIKEYPDGRKEVIRLEKRTRREFFVCAYNEKANTILY